VTGIEKWHGFDFGAATDLSRTEPSENLQWKSPRQCQVRIALLALGEQVSQVRESKGGGYCGSFTSDSVFTDVISY